MIKVRLAFKGELQKTEETGWYTRDTVFNPERAAEYIRQSRFNDVTKSYFISQVRSAPLVLDENAYIMYWEDEPESNEWGEICP